MMRQEQLQRASNANCASCMIQKLLIDASERDQYVLLAALTVCERIVGDAFDQIEAELADSDDL